MSNKGVKRASPGADIEKNPLGDVELSDEDAITLQSVQKDVARVELALGTCSSHPPMPPSHIPRPPCRYAARLTAGATRRPCRAPRTAEDDARVRKAARNCQGH